MDNNIALKTLRQNFTDKNKELIAKLEGYEKTENIKTSLGHYDFDYIKFFKIRKRGFLSVLITELFEIMIYVHFFEHLNTTTLDLKDYIKSNKLDKDRLIKDAISDTNTITAISAVKKRASQLMAEIGIDKSEDLLNNRSSIMALLNSIRYAMDKTLHHFGDHEFLVSKLPIDNKCVIQKDILLTDQIFYTHKPEQIIAMAQITKPGIYIIANVPYKEYAETAFYVLFKFEKGAYLVENCKHSYRQQHYRDKSYGVNGHDAWLGDRYEYSYFPINTVLDYFNNMPEEKAVGIKDKGHSFKALGRITDACEILWLHAFKDKCLQILSDEAFTANLSTAMSMEFIQPKITKSSDNVPAIYRDQIPTLSEIDTTWSNEKVGTQGNMANSLEQHIKDTQIDIKHAPMGRLIPQAQIERELIYLKREQDAKDLQKRLNQDFLENYEKVFSSIKTFIKQYGHKRGIKRALESHKYPLKVYKQFASKNVHIKRGDISGIIQDHILYSVDIGKKEFHDIDIEQHTPFQVSYRDTRLIYLNRNERKCSICEQYKGKYAHTAQFLDYLQFKSFFELTEREEKQLPHQLKDFLNQECTIYYGNNILDDVDPLCLLENPWWRKEFNTKYGLYNPAIFLKFYTCKRCLNYFNRGKGLYAKKL